MVSRPTRVGCTLAVVVAVAGCSSASQQSPSKPSFVPMPDPASIQQVIDPAKEFVVLNRLQDVSGSFSWVACGGQDEARYYGEARVYFRMPEDMDAQRYVGTIAHMMVSHGWMDAPAPGERSFGTLIHTSEVRAIITGGSRDNPETGQIQLLGECRNTTDHRGNATAVSITDRLRQR
jgi:hypothetical protein